MKDEAFFGAFATLAMLVTTVCAAWAGWPLPELFLVGGACIMCDVATAYLALSD